MKKETGNDTRMSITLTDINKFYGKQHAVNQLSFTTGSQRVIGFLGPNGAGKSTTMKMIAGILPADNGHIRIHDIDIHQDPLRAKSTIGYLPEHNPLYTEMFVTEALEFEASIHQIRHAKKRIDEVIDATGIGNERHKKIKQLSKGYRQRVGIAMAIIHDPQVLILDEPTTGLDPNQIIEIRKLIQHLAIDKTILLSTHLMQEVASICDEVIIIHQGQLKEHFTMEELSIRYAGQSMEDIFVKATRIP